MTVEAIAWSWIMAHREDVDRIVGRFARESGMDRDDLRSSTVLRLVEKHGRFDPDLGTAQTWIYWTTREVATRARRRVIPIADLDLDELSVSARVDEQIDARRAARIILAEANESQIGAVESVVEGWSADEVQDRLGCSLPTRNARVYRLRDRLRERIG